MGDEEDWDLEIENDTNGVSITPQINNLSLNSNKGKSDRYFDSDDVDGQQEDNSWNVAGSGGRGGFNRSNRGYGNRGGRGRGRGFR